MFLLFVPVQQHLRSRVEFGDGEVIEDYIVQKAWGIVEGNLC